MVNQEEYKPSRKDVFNEIGNQVSKRGEKALNYIKKNAGDFIDMQRIIYALPTIFKGKPKEVSSGDVLGFAAVFGQGSFYLASMVDILNNGHRHFQHDWWLIPLGTNAICGLYKVGKAIYKNNEKNLIEEHNLKGLEKEVKE